MFTAYESTFTWEFYDLIIIAWLCCRTARVPEYRTVVCFDEHLNACFDCKFPLDHVASVLRKNCIWYEQFLSLALYESFSWRFRVYCIQFLVTVVLAYCIIWKFVKSPPPSHHTTHIRWHVLASVAVRVPSHPLLTHKLPSNYPNHYPVRVRSLWCNVRIIICGLFQPWAPLGDSRCTLYVSAVRLRCAWWENNVSKCKILSLF